MQQPGWLSVNYAEWEEKVLKGSILCDSIHVRFLKQPSHISEDQMVTRDGTLREEHRNGDEKATWGIFVVKAMFCISTLSMTIL